MNKTRRRKQRARRRDAFHRSLYTYFGSGPGLEHIAMAYSITRVENPKYDGNRIIVDEPPELTDDQRRALWDEFAPPRLKDGSIVIIKSRLHEADEMGAISDPPSHAMLQGTIVWPGYPQLNQPQSEPLTREGLSFEWDPEKDAG